MKKNNEQRKEKRLSYNWPIRFAEDFDETLAQGQMVDVSSSGASFICPADKHCPYPDQYITALFSVPRFGRRNYYDMANYNRIGRVCRVDNVNTHLRRVAMQFSKPLFFKPGEQGISDDESQQRLRTASATM
ncbi:MAG: PilZ domain-containing protein [Planctomycetota bacterium]|jgi:hypothetical protein